MKRIVILSCMFLFMVTANQVIAQEKIKDKDDKTKVKDKAANYKEKDKNGKVKIKDENVRWNIAMAFNCSFGNKYPEDALKFLKILSGDKSKVVSRAVLSTLRSLNKRHPRLIGKFIKKSAAGLFQ